MPAFALDPVVDAPIGPPPPAPDVPIPVPPPPPPGPPPEGDPPPVEPPFTDPGFPPPVIDPPPPMQRTGELPFGKLHARRLREIYRSAGWPCCDAIEVELLAGGFLERMRTPHGHETLRVTDAGIARIATTLTLNRAALSPHEALVERVAREMQRAGRVVWRGLSLRAPLAASVIGPDGQAVAATRWAMAMPDVYSIRHTTVEDYVEPIVHEVKVRRADLLADLKREAKRAAYLNLASECWYVLREGIATADEVPAECGVIVAAGSALEVVRPAPKRAMRLPFATWMALARATPLDGWRAEEAQGWLGAIDVDGGAPYDGGSSTLPER